MTEGPNIRRSELGCRPVLHLQAASLLLVVTLAAFTTHAGAVAPYTDCRASVTNGTFRLEPLPQNRIFTSVLVSFVVEEGHSSPPSFILSGKVVSNNTGGPIEGVAISIRAPGQAPRLAAISDTDGSFRFRVWIDAAPQSIPPSTEQMYINLRQPSITDGDLCLGGAFDTNRVMVSGTVSRYSLGDLKAAAKKPTSQK